MATVSPGLLPSTVGVAFTARNNLRTASPPKTPSVFRESVLERENIQEKLKSPTLQAADPKLSVIEVENMIREGLQKNADQILSACQNYDVDQSLSITKGEFRRVMEAYCMPVTTEQFTALINKANQSIPPCVGDDKENTQVPLNANGTVRYADFMEKFGANPKRVKAVRMAEKWTSASPKYGIRAPSPKERNGDMIEKMLKDKIQNNLRNVMKGMRLYDYNRDGTIQKHELRKVLENNCFRMSDTQFDKLYQRYDFHHRGSLNYKDFLLRLGVQLEEPRPATTTGMPATFKWQEYADQQRKAMTPSLGIDNRQAGDMRPTHPATKLAGMALHSIEMEFRKMMVENYVDIKRMFMAFDKYNDGFIHLPDLAAVLSQFTIPMSNQLFSQLMERCGVKASGKISWEYFLEKFQDPQAHGNGQTITIKPAHKFNPIRGDHAAVSFPELVKLLVDQVHNGYSSLKQAFLEIDKNRDGKITRKELVQVLRTFKVRIEPDQLKQLNQMLDPAKTNFISYQRFLDLFEERETKEGHQWLNSCHRYNEKQKPIVMAWETIEEILRNKIQDNWRDFSACLIKYDTTNSQSVQAKDLRRSIEKYSIPISTDHFNHMVAALGCSPEDKVNYVEFLQRLGVTVKPGDQIGLSTQIHEASNDAEGRRIEEQTIRLARGEMRALEKTGQMSPEEVIMRLRDKVAQNTAVIRKAFLQYDTKKNGKVSKKSFRRVLEKIGFNVNDIIFENICAKLAFNEGYMMYSDFVTNFEDPRSGGPAAELMKANNHKVNPIRGDSFGMTALEVESKLRNKLRANFEDLRGAFYKFDDNHDGLLTKGNFRRMLDAFMCFMDNEEFEKLCQRLELDNKSRLDYQKFLEKFEVRDTEEGHKWLVSDHRYNETNPPKWFTADEVYAALSKKAHQQFADLSKAFCRADSRRDGMIRKDGLRQLLAQFILPVNKDEFKKLWAMYDTQGKGHITHAEFIKHLMGEEFAPSDLNGLSYSVIKESYRKLERHHKDQERKQERITLHQAEKVSTMDIDTILQQLKDRIREQYDDFYTAFKKYDSHKNGYLTANNIQKILTDYNYFLDDDQFYDLLEKLKLHEKRRLSYSDFLEVLQEGRKDNYQPKAADATPTTGIDKSTPEAAIAILNDKVALQLDVLKKAFSAFDQHNLGYIPPEDFRRILDNFCFKLNNSQFKFLISKMPVNKEGNVDYRNYLETFRMSDVDADKWIDMVNRRLRAETPATLTEDEVQAYLKEQIASKYHHLVKGFTEIDYARIGVVTRDDFKNILSNQSVRLSDEQFTNLWSTLSVNEFGNLDYTDFLRKFTSDLPRPATSLPPTRAGTSAQLGRLSVASSLDRRSVMSRSGPAAPVRSFTPMVNAENVERRIKDVVVRHWKEIQRCCREADIDSTKQIPYDVFKQIIRQLDSGLKDEDMNTLFLKYDLKNNNHFCYHDFLRQFVLVMQPQREASSLLNRKKLDAPKVASPPGGSATNAGDAASRVRQCVVLNWKEMRRQFAKHDTKNCSTITSDDMRQVLRNFKLNLDETEFQNLVSIYDKNLDGQINYNNFVRAFIHTL